MSERVIIMGAAGRDFHDFNTKFRGNDDYEVVAFTMAGGQNLGEVEAGERVYPASLAGDQYPDGVPIKPESELKELIREHDVDTVFLSYSDLSHIEVMNKASKALSEGADFQLIGTDTVMLEADVPVVAVDAVRTGCGKSQTTRKIAGHLKDMGYNTVIVREPMPYGDLEEQVVMRFDSEDDLDRHDSTIEEREEYEQHIEAGHTVFSGVDYQKVLDEAQEEADVVLWDGGNNELPFFRPDVHFVLADPHRPGHETSYHPGETNLHMADYVIVNKENTASQKNIDTVVDNIRSANPEAGIIHADSVVSVSDPDAIKGKDVLVVEDGPTLTHGGTTFGAGRVAAEKHDATIIDPRDAAVGSIKETFHNYPHIGNVLPAMGYADEQLAELEETINNADCDVVLLGTPADLRNVLDVNKPVVRVRYDLEEKDMTLKQVLEKHKDVLDQA